MSRVALSIFTLALLGKRQLSVLVVAQPTYTNGGREIDDVFVKNSVLQLGKDSVDVIFF